MHDFVRKLMGIKGIGFIALALAAGILLIVLSDRSKTSDGSGIVTAGGEEFSFDKYEEELEERLEEILSRMDGVSSVSVMVVLDRSYEEQLAGDDGDYLLVRDQSGSQTGLETARIAPTVRGVAVVCHGGENVEIRKEIIELLSSLLNLSTARIYVGGVS